MNLKKRLLALSPSPIRAALLAFLPSAGLHAELLSQHEFEGDFSDSSGNGHTAVSAGNGRLVDDPERGKVYEVPAFETVHSYLDLDQTIGFPNLPANGNLTLAIWVKRDDYEAGTNAIFGPGNLVGALALGTGGDTPIASVGVNNDGAVNGFIEGDGGADQVQITSPAGLVPDGIWTHLAAVFDRVNDVARLYVNGAQVGNVFDISIVGDGELDWAGAQIGTLAVPDNVNFDFQGRLDDARIYDEALTAAQIAALANATLPKPLTLSIRPGTGDGSLQLDWNSRPGKVYDLLSSVNLIDWEVWDDGVNPPYRKIVAEADRSTLTIPMPEDDSRYFAIQESLPAGPQGAPVKVFLLAGQSNMQGIEINAELEAPLDQSQEDVKIWSGANWTSLQPGFGNRGENFGPEVSFGRAMAEGLPDENIYLIKYARGGSGLVANDDWNPSGGSDYLAFISRVKSALGQLAADGIEFEIGGMLWMQGEHDTLESATAAGYETSLRQFIETLRDDFETPGMPFVIGRITTEFGTTANNTLVREAQVRVAEETEGVFWVDTDELSLGTPGHYGTEGQLDLGRLFAGEILAPDVVWSMVVVPCSHLQPYFAGQMQWVADHKLSRKIALMIHNGDFVNTNRASEWAEAKAAIEVLDGEVPYLLNVGNHELGPGGEAGNRDTLLNDYFSLGDNPLNLSATEGIVTTERIPGQLENTYATFTAPDGRKVLVFSLEFGPRQEVVDWANDIAGREEFRNHTAILSTHAYLDLQSEGGRASSRWSPHQYGLAPDVHDGQELWEELVGVHGHFEMTFNSHYVAAVDRQMSVGCEGNVVHEMLHNRQYETFGYLRLLEFLKDGTTVRVSTYSTAGRWLSDPANQFEIKISER